MNNDSHAAPRSGIRLVLVTGPSGAGRTTAIHALEDFGFEAIDNLPLSLLPRLLSGPPMGQPLALGLDTRNRDFSVEALNEAITLLDQNPGFESTLLYLDCAPETLLRRYSETRRRHPLAPGESPIVGVEREVELLAPIRDRADQLIDTTDLSPNVLRAELQRWFDTAGGKTLAVGVQSFSYKRGLPRAVDMVLDCRFLRNPYWEPALRAGSGRDPAVAEYIARDARFDAFDAQLNEMLNLLLPAYLEEGKSHFTIAFGCTGGQHRSVAMAERLARKLAGDGWQVSVRHRELERRADAPPG